MKTHLFFTTLVCSSLLILAACGGPKDADKIADAQNCLDQAAPPDVPACLSKIEGIESESAYLIRCAGKFVKEGFGTPAKLSATMAGFNGGQAGTNGSTSMMASLAFQAEATTDLNSASANEAFEHCSKAKSKGMILLSGLAMTSTGLAKLMGLASTSMTSSDLKNLMGTLKDDPAAKEVVGTAIATIYTTNCSNDGKTAGNYCAQFEAAAASVGGVQNTSALGSIVMKCYNDPTLPECAGFQ